MGEVTREKVYATSINRYQGKIDTLRRAPLTLRDKIALLETWALPVFFHLGQVVAPGPAQMRRINQLTRHGLKLWSLTVTIDTLAADKEVGGRGMIQPEMYMQWIHSRTLARFWSGDMCGMERRELGRSLEDFCRQEE